MIEMALKNVMHTPNPICEYAFSWTIDNFSKTSPEVRGPSFSPIPGYPDRFCFELKFRIVTDELDRTDYDDLYPEYEDDEPSTLTVHSGLLDVNLLYLNARDLTLQLVSNLTSNTKIHRQKRVTLVEESNTIYTYRDLFLRKNCIDTVLLDMGLKDSKLIIEGTLQFSGYGMTSSIYPLSVLQNSSENCGELSNDLKTMYESGLGSDVTFSVDDRKLRAHKTILLGRSPVFAKMFEHDMLENRTNYVTIEDVDFHTFNCFLVFLYTGVVEDDKYETVISLYSVAEKYQVKSLRKACFVLLVNQLSVECVCSVLMLADLHADEELKNVVKIFIRENFFDIVGTIKWAELLINQPTLADEVLSYMKYIHK